MNKYISDFCTLYLDFDPYSKSYLSNLEFSWFDQGFYILKDICPKKLDAVNNEIEYVMTMTSKTIGGGNKTIDTMHFRNAIRCYIEVVMGIYNEDYNYASTNRLLLINHKVFIKNVACYPSKISKEDMISLRATFSYQEVFHLLYLTATIKQKVQLTYLSKAFNEIMNGLD